MEAGLSPQNGVSSCGSVIWARFLLAIWLIVFLDAQSRHLQYETWN